jgi:hypothetical protein
MRLRENIPPWGYPFSSPQVLRLFSIDLTKYYTEINQSAKEDKTQIEKENSND